MRHLIVLLAWTGAILLLDQWSKHLVLVYVADRAIRLGPLVTLRRVLSVQRIHARAGRGGVLVLFWLTALVSALLLIRLGGWFRTSSAQLGLAAAFSGATGNLLDILRRRAIVDFVDLGWWPVFNLADVAIVAGLLVAFWRG